MDDLISRAAAIDAIVSATSFLDADSIKSICNIGNGEEWVDGVYDAIIAVEDVNAVDAAPVVHGEWIEQHVDYASDCAIDEVQTAKCSVCGLYHTTPYLYSFTDYKYCPNCGAKNVEE